MALQDFISRIKEVGLPISNRYLVEFLNTASFNGGRDVSILVDQVAIPGINLMTSDRRIFGEITESVFGVTYQPVNMSVYVDNNSSAKKFFDDWTNRVWDRRNRTIGYYRDYVRDVRITLQDKNDEPIYQVILREAWPKTISDITLDYANRDIIKLNVIITFKYWEEQYVDPEQVLQARNAILNPARDRFFDRTRANLPSDVVGPTAGGVNSFQWGAPPDVGSSLARYGQGMGASISQSLGALAREIGDSEMIDRLAIQQTLNSLSSNFAQLGAGVSDLGGNLGSVGPPLTTMTAATGAIGTNLGSLYTSFAAAGMDSNYNTLGDNFTTASTNMSTVTTVEECPEVLRNVGGNMSALGNEFKQSSRDSAAIAGSNQRIINALSKLGYNVQRQGDNMYNGSTALKDYTNI